MLLVSALVFFVSTNMKHFAQKYASEIISLEDKYATHYNKTHSTSDIDLVYTWVDGNDTAWQKEKDKWAKVYGLEKTWRTNRARYVDNGELKYSLRSVEKYAPWINNIYIVTNGQVPKWLNTDHPKIKIITHDQIMPKSELPTFNSMAIEANLAHIPNLSEKFLYANDDFFIGRAVTPGFFYTPRGKSKLIISETIPKQDELFDYYSQVVKYSFNLIYKKDSKEKEIPVFTHNITPYLKSYFLECEKEYKNEFEKVTKAKFRQNNTIIRYIVSYYTKNKGMALYVSPLIRKDLYTDTIDTDYLDAQIKLKKPVLFCINDVEMLQDSDREMIKPFLQKLFPEKSAFEK